MSYYRVTVDGVDIYDPKDRNKILFGPVVSPAIDEAGSFDFAINSDNEAYTRIVPFGSDIEVWEDGELIFFGRALPPSIGLYNTKTYHCEGALAYLNDIIVVPLSKTVEAEPNVNGDGFTSGDDVENGGSGTGDDGGFIPGDSVVGDDGGFVSGDDVGSGGSGSGSGDSGSTGTGGFDSGDGGIEGDLAPAGTKKERQRTITISDYITYVFLQINQWQTKANRKLLLGTVDIEYDALLVYDSDYKTALEVLRDEIMPYTNCHMIARKSGGSIYIDFVRQYPRCNQPIKAGINLLEFAAAQGQFYTAVICKGGIKEGDPLKEPVAMLEPVVSEYAATYGVICAYKHYPDATNEESLARRAGGFLSSQQFEAMTFNVSAFDLHISNKAYDSLKVGSEVVFVSTIHGVPNTVLIVTSIKINMETGEKTVTLGDEGKVTLTQQWHTRRINNTTNIKKNPYWIGTEEEYGQIEDYEEGMIYYVQFDDE